jgi:hypothetical protein
MIEPAPAAELAMVREPAVVPAAPNVGVAVQDAAVVLVAFGIVPAAADVAFTPPCAMATVGRSVEAIARNAGSADGPAENSALVVLASGPMAVGALVVLPA